MKPPVDSCLSQLFPFHSVEILSADSFLGKENLNSGKGTLMVRRFPHETRKWKRKSFLTAGSSFPSVGRLFTISGWSNRKVKRMPSQARRGKHTRFLSTVRLVSFLSWREDRGEEKNREGLRPQTLMLDLRGSEQRSTEDDSNFMSAAVIIVSGQIRKPLTCGTNSWKRYRR